MSCVCNSGVYKNMSVRVLSVRMVFVRMYANDVYKRFGYVLFPTIQILFRAPGMQW